METCKRVASREYTRSHERGRNRRERHGNMAILVQQAPGWELCVIDAHMPTSYQLRTLDVNSLISAWSMVDAATSACNNVVWVLSFEQAACIRDMGKDQRWSRASSEQRLRSASSRQLAVSVSCETRDERRARPASRSARGGHGCPCGCAPSRHHNFLLFEARCLPRTSRWGCAWLVHGSCGVCG